MNANQLLPRISAFAPACNRGAEYSTVIVEKFGYVRGNILKIKNLMLVGIASLSLVLAGCASGNDTPATSGTPTDALPEGVFVTDSGAQALALGDPVTGGALTVGHFAPIESLDPTTSVGSGAAVMRAIFDVLFVYDAKGEVVPELAESLETTDGGKTWIMKLPADVKFTDGTDFNSEAIVKHLENLASEGSMSRAAGDVRQIESMSTPDALTLEMVLKEPNMTFPKVFVWGIPGGPSMIPSPTAVEKLGDSFGSAPVGAGPFQVKSFQSGGDVVLERNPDYYLSEYPYLDELTFKNTTDSQSRLAAAQAGDIDMGSSKSATDMVQARDAGLIPLHQPDGSYYNLLYNLEKEPFDDVRFRTAVIQALDLNSLNDAVFDGLHTPMEGMVPTTNPHFVETDWPTFDLEAAKQLVAEYQADGGTAEFTVTTTSPPEFQKQAAVMQQMLKEAGITMNINVADQPTMVTEALAGNFQAQHRYVDVREEFDQLLRTGYHSESTGNFSQVGNPKLDALLDELKTEEGQARRSDIFAEIQVVLAEWVPITPLVAHSDGWYVGDQVGGFPGVRVGISEPDWRQIWKKES